MQYVFHVSSRTAYGSAAGGSTNIICTFTTAQAVSCWVGSADYVSGDASNTAGLTSSSGKVKVFTGLRDDPFFFNLDGFKDAAATVRAAKSSLTFDAAGCPALDSGTSTTLVNKLKNSPGSSSPVDHFSGLNALSIVLSVDKTILTSGGPLVSVWAATHRP